jgi:hypothetical protein
MPKKKSVRLRVRAAIGDTVHRAAARAKAVVENGANSQKEPRDFVQHKTSGKDPVALWDHRWNRKRKLLPNLRLTYPSDEELFEIAQLAEVTDASSFAQHMWLSTGL